LKRHAIIAEYDEFYKAKPEKWTSDSRDEFTYRALLDFLGEPPKTLIDVGCGNGHTVAFLQKRWPETKFTGLDLSAEAIRLARLKAPGAMFVRGFLDETYGLHQFEVVLLLGVAEHFEDISGGLARVRGLIAPGGVAYIEVPNCIAHPKSKPIEGFRRLNHGSRQMEWHLYRPTWEKHIKNAFLEIVRSLDGSHDPPEFIWIVR
jgi:trans-aconitate methyltransferase